MTAQELELILEAGEGFNAEFKQSISKDIAEEVCAFANAAGGTLLIGVNNDNKVCGIQSDNTLRSRIVHSLEAIDPTLDVRYEEIDYQNKTVIVLSCNSGKKKPYTVSGAIFIRIGPNSQKITSVEEMRDFFQQSERIYFDEVSCQSIDPAFDFDSDAFTNFLSRAGISNLLGQKILQENLKLIAEDGKLKNGAALFFARNVQRVFENAIVRCVQYKGLVKRFPIDKKDMVGNLLQQYEQSINYVISKLNLKYEIESQGAKPRKEILEIPEIVFKEVLINALAHRDYYDKGACTMIELFDDRVEVSNPGGLVNGIPRDQFGKRSLSRNPLIFGLFARINMVEQIGSGIARIRDAMKEAGLLPPTFNVEGIFTVTLLRPVDFEKWLAESKSLFGETKMRILRMVNDNPAISKYEMEKAIGINKSAIDKHISALRQSGVLIRMGADKGGTWKIITMIME
jgi:ATP-dependent DNA helicase RecG